MLFQHLNHKQHLMEFDSVILISLIYNKLTIILQILFMLTLRRETVVNLLEKKLIFISNSF